jgi:hypothetical protein
VALPIRLGLLPHNEFGLRFWDALFGAIALLYVFAVGRRMAAPMCGLIAGLVLFARYRGRTAEPSAPIISFGNVLLIMPGPYAACSPERTSGIR